MLKFKIISRLLESKETVGYFLVRQDSMKSALKDSEVFSLADKGLIINAKLNSSKDGLNGIDCDLRKLPTKQLKEALAEVKKQKEEKSGFDLSIIGDGVLLIGQSLRIEVSETNGEITAWSSVIEGSTKGGSMKLIADDLDNLKLTHRGTAHKLSSKGTDKDSLVRFMKVINSNALVCVKSDKLKDAKSGIETHIKIESGEFNGYVAFAGIGETGDTKFGDIGRDIIIARRATIKKVLTELNELADKLYKPNIVPAEILD